MDGWRDKGGGMKRQKVEEHRGMEKQWDDGRLGLEDGGMQEQRGRAMAGQGWKNGGTAGQVG